MFPNPIADDGDIRRQENQFQTANDSVSGKIFNNTFCGYLAVVYAEAKILIRMVFDNFDESVQNRPHGSIADTVRHQLQTVIESHAGQSFQFFSADVHLSYIICHPRRIITVRFSQRCCSAAQGAVGNGFKWSDAEKGTAVACFVAQLYERL